MLLRVMIKLFNSQFTDQGKYVTCMDAKEFSEMVGLVCPSLAKSISGNY